MRQVFQQMPIDAGFMIPLMPLSDFTAHEEQLLSRLSVHVSEKKTQVGKLLPVISRHLPYQRAFSVNHFIMRERQDKIFVEGVDHAECKVTMMEAPVNGIE